MSGLDASANNFAFDSDNDYERPKDGNLYIHSLQSTLTTLSI